MKGFFFKRRTLVWLGFLAATYSVRADPIPGYFSQINMQGGGYFPAIIQHSSGRLVGRTDGGGIYCSDDRGISWKYLSGGFTTPAALIPQGIAVPQIAGSDSNLMLQAVGVSYLSADPSRGIWKSTNGGSSWTQQLSGVNFSGGDQERTGGECLIFHPANNTEVWAGSRGQGLWKSLDSGNTWTEVGGPVLTNVIIASVCVHPAYPDQIFVGGDGGLWVSVNHGANWTQLKIFDLVLRVTRGADGTVYIGGLSGGLQVLQKITSTNWGTPAAYTFTDLTPAYWNSIGDDRNAIVCLTVLRDGRLVAGDFDGFTRISSDEGQSFTSLPQAFVSGSVVPKWSGASAVWPPNSLVQDVTASNTWYGGGGYGPMRTDDGGQTWQYIVNGIGEVVTYKIGFHPADPNRVYIPCADHGGAIVTDGGASGAVAAMATPFFAWPNDIVMFSHRALASASNGVNRVIFPGGEEINNTARLYVTTNDGAGWFKAAALGLPSGGGQAIVEAIDSLDNPDDFLVVCGGATGLNAAGIYRTADAGLSFTQCGGIPAGQWWGDLHYWNVSLDRDATNVNERYLYNRAAYPGGSDGGLYRSLDRGATWTQLPWPLLPDWYGALVADHGISGSLWISFTPSAPQTNGLGHSTDGGLTWSIVPGFTNVLTLDALNGNICLFGARTNDASNKIYYSANNGSTWNEITRPGNRFANVTALACDPYRPGRVWISTDERSVGIFTPAGPVITSAILSGPVLILNGSVGAASAGAVYSVLTSTNAALSPLSLWTVLSAGQPLDAAGNFSYTATNAPGSGASSQFYLIRVP